VHLSVTHPSRRELDALAPPISSEDNQHRPMITDLVKAISKAPANN
jgi:hypothetical protein